MKLRSQGMAPCASSRPHRGVRSIHDLVRSVRWRREGWHRLGHAVYHLGICRRIPLRSTAQARPRYSRNTVTAHQAKLTAPHVGRRWKSILRGTGRASAAITRHPHAEVRLSVDNIELHACLGKRSRS